ncbi:hypothetical protein [Robinsoniella sp.]|uniref:hypothetical protein n=1 Tax=Robinsoniella sp. TaxID=2496533 RepID=UPI00375376C6
MEARAGPKGLFIMHKNNGTRRGTRMNDEEVAVKIAELGKDSRSLKARVADLEAQQKCIQELAMSVKELALNMKTMMEEQKKQGDRLQKLENEPAERWNSAKKTAFTTIVSVISGALATGLIFMAVQYL